MSSRFLVFIFCLTFSMAPVFSPGRSFFVGSGFAYAGETPGTWGYYKAHFINPDGRVMDLFQNRISHSEGQGYGLLLSLHNNDKATFENILRWTQNNLMVRKDDLAAWSWGKRDSGEWAVIDYNNATDGDLLIAWALLGGSTKWQNSEWKALAEGILHCVQKSLIIIKNNRMVLLPGYYGFTARSGKSANTSQTEEPEEINVKINISYFLFPAFKSFADASEKAGKEDDKKFWQRLYSDSLAIFKQSLSSSMNLPPDWMNLDAKGNSVRDKNIREEFGYDAIRVPLYLAMAGDKKALETFTPYLRFCNRLGYVPAKVDLMDEQIAIQEGSAGIHALLSKCAGMVGETEVSKSLMQKAETKIVQEPDDYYSNTLYLLARTVEL